MNKKYIVRLLDTEREVLRDVIKQLKGSSQKVRRAQILLKADVDGPGWTDEKSADAFSCRVQTVESIRQRLVTEGFEVTLNGRKPDKPPREKTFDGEQEAKVIALRALIMASATPFCFCTTQKYLAVKRIRSSMT